MAASPALQSERGWASMNSEKTQAPGDPQRSTPLPAIREAHARLLATYATGRTRRYEWRVEQLEGVRRLLTENSERVCDAVRADLGRPKMESVIGEVTPVVAEIDHVLKNLKGWMDPEKVSTPMLQQPGRSAVLREPKGVVLLLSAWNFPVSLALTPVVAALCAGNCCLLKPSEISPASEALLKELLPRYVDPEAVAVVTGAIPEATALLELRWDHIMYTGNGAVARVVARAAAEHLTPCTLELGGKSPTIVLPGANLKVAARRILSGKCLNAGQICIAPDYALVHQDVQEELVQEMRKSLTDWYGKDAAQSPNFGRIVNNAHFNRIKRLVESSDGKVLVQQGQMDEATKFIPPTLIEMPGPDSALMNEEIFGPILPILKVSCVGDVVRHINANEKPLAMYIFGKESQADEIIQQTSSGGVCVNDTIFHYANPELPFGGVGGSGMGRYHGKWGFDEFSHMRAVMYRATWIDPHLRYPPYSDTNLRMMERLFLGPLVPPAVKKAITALGAAVGVGAAARLISRL